MNDFSPRLSKLPSTMPQCPWPFPWRGGRTKGEKKKNRETHLGRVHCTTTFASLQNFCCGKFVPWNTNVNALGVSGLRDVQEVVVVLFSFLDVAVIQLLVLDCLDESL
ncbi:hypothetical protein CEXT_485051 [Caerostris extrusa]|uniref:Uncharacterized protein n=1 Tax=Caerostris extrusa TaxID=172846 RepID=A0AAV4Q368_CAEEX|nr:hypothetical protein CEXT_485051 [Caerostris extrusa]